jgi:hypothetical protein
MFSMRCMLRQGIAAEGSCEGPGSGLDPPEIAIWKPIATGIALMHTVAGGTEGALGEVI